MGTYLSQHQTTSLMDLQGHPYLHSRLFGPSGLQPPIFHHDYQYQSGRTQANRPNTTPLPKPSASQDVGALMPRFSTPAEMRNDPDGYHSWADQSIIQQPQGCNADHPGAGTYVAPLKPESCGFREQPCVGHSEPSSSEVIIGDDNEEVPHTSDSHHSLPNAEDSPGGLTGCVNGPVSLEILKLSPFSTTPIYSEYDNVILIYSAYTVHIHRSAGQLIQTDIIIHFPPKVYGYVSAYHKPGNPQELEVFPFALNVSKQENVILYLYNSSQEPYTVTQGEVVAMVSVYQTVLPILRVWNTETKPT